ncbi:esterase/lipase/thioesterase [Luminiphilus syltensis NOR5-1B]|uniref:Esterase/lipase/thioesterase n=1 Tax=Luminiphilus syltensis NOR5-1B TaxID=565045 RepID=B8KTM9_9GAMM|nr:alpha/beta hydrolase [Luminiphilus syltensis]EED34756.1 esterase/lipase/thioesterase [Luminiphilus syltensis NOR5-1B]
MTKLLKRLEARIVRLYYRHTNERAWRGHINPAINTSTLVIPADPAPITARMYHGSADKPLIVFFHGGGWVIGDLDTHHPYCARLSHTTGCTVMSIDYRLAPEHPWPAAHDDCYAATRWIIDNLNKLAPNNGRLVLAGDSAGGNLAGSTAIRIGRDPRLAGNLLIYPACEHYSAGLPSYREHARSRPLTAPVMRWFVDMYLAGTAPADPSLDTLFFGKRRDWRGFAPTLIITAERDPIRDDGKRLAQSLRQSGVAISSHHYSDEAHGFAVSEGPTEAFQRALQQVTDWLDTLTNSSSASSIQRTPLDNQQYGVSP